MDLGNIITQLGSQYITSRFQQPVQQQPVLFDPLTNWLTGGDDTSTPTATAQQCSGMVYDPTKGKWVKKSRRRRKRLATQSDLKDLAALKGILGSGEAFKVWIATHGR